MLKKFKSRYKIMVKVTCLKFILLSEGLVIRNTYVNYETLSLRKRSYVLYKSFSKVGQRSRSRSHVQNLWYQRKGLVTRNAK